MAIRTAMWLQAKVRHRGLSQRPRLYDCSVCDDSAAETVYAANLALYKATLPLFIQLFYLNLYPLFMDSLIVVRRSSAATQHYVGGSYNQYTGVGGNIRPTV